MIPYYIYFVHCCRICNTYVDNILIERMYQYENYITILNKTICDILVSKSLSLIKINQEFDCKYEFSDKGFGYNNKIIKIPKEKFLLSNDI